MKIHLFISPIPISPGEDREAACGKIVARAQAIPLSDVALSVQLTTIFCKKCFGRNYFYAIMDGQSAEDLKRDE